MISNINQYVFSEENNKYLLHFLQVAKVVNKKYCNLTDHQILTKFIPLPRDVHIQTEFENKCNEIIDLTDSYEEILSSNFEYSQILVTEDTNIQTVNDLKVNDMLSSVKEHLQTEKILPNSILNNLNNVICSDQQKIYSLLSELKFEEVINFGTSLKSINICNDLIISYIRYLLLEKLTLEYSGQLQQLLNDFSIKFSEDVLEELTQSLLRKEPYSKVFLQFIDGLTTDFKELLLRRIVLRCEKFEENYFQFIEILIVPEIAFDTLSRLLEIMVNSKNNFNANKYFGKFLMNLMKLLGKNVVLFEQPLKHVIGSHKSIWKAKLHKKLDDCLEENFMLSQNISRY